MIRSPSGISAPRTSTARLAWLALSTRTFASFPDLSSSPDPRIPHICTYLVDRRLSKDRTAQRDPYQTTKPLPPKPRRTSLPPAASKAVAVHRTDLPLLRRPRRLPLLRLRLLLVERAARGRRLVRQLQAPRLVLRPVSMLRALEAC